MMGYFRQGHDYFFFAGKYPWVFFLSSVTLTTAAFLSIAPAGRVLARQRKLPSFIRKIEILGQVNPAEFRKLLLWSLLRYLIFSLQFYIILMMLNTRQILLPVSFCYP
jgi:hypothetical protein